MTSVVAVWQSLLKQEKEHHVGQGKAGADTVSTSEEMTEITETDEQHGRKICLDITSYMNVNSCDILVPGNSLGVLPLKSVGPRSLSLHVVSVCKEQLYKSALDHCLRRILQTFFKQNHPLGKLAACCAVDCVVNGIYVFICTFHPFHSYCFALSQSDVLHTLGIPGVNLSDTVWHLCFYMKLVNY